MSTFRTSRPLIPCVIRSNDRRLRESNNNNTCMAFVARYDRTADFCLGTLSEWHADYFGLNEYSNRWYCAYIRMPYISLDYNEPHFVHCQIISERDTRAHNAFDSNGFLP